MALDPSDEGIRYYRDATVSRANRLPQGQHPSIVRNPKPRRGFTEIVPTEEYRSSEARIFNLLTADYQGGAWGYRYVDITNGDGAALADANAALNGDDKDPLTAAWCSVYLYSVYTENRRPKVWLDRAAIIIRDIADFILTRQAGSATAHTDVGKFDAAAGVNLTAYDAADLEWGGVFHTYGSGDLYSDVTAMGGLALLNAYRIHGDNRYRAGYLAAVKFLYRQQQSHTATDCRTEIAAGGAPLETGMWSRGLGATDTSGCIAIGSSEVTVGVDVDYTEVTLHTYTLNAGLLANDGETVQADFTFHHDDANPCFDPVRARVYWDGVAVWDSLNYFSKLGGVISYTVSMLVTRTGASAQGIVITVTGLLGTDVTTTGSASTISAIEVKATGYIGITECGPSGNELQVTASSVTWCPA